METRCYSIRHGKGGATFTCNGCNYQLRSKDFDPRNGNVRTQAAAAMRLHYESEHKVNVRFITSTDPQGAERVWRSW